MRRALLTIFLLLIASAALAGDARVRVTLKPEVVDVEAAARELAETYAAKLVAIEGNDVVVELSVPRSGLVARDPHVAAVTVLGSAAAAPAVKHSSAAPPPQKSFIPRTNNTCTPPGLPCSTGTYLYDGSGNIKQIGSDRFVYDEVSRLTSATLPSAGGVGETYTYDAFGNLQSVNSSSGEGRPTIITDKATNHLDPVSTQAIYDEGGNLKAWPGHTYTYDAANMLIEMVATGGEHAAYVYTADDERIAVLNVVSSTAYEGTWRLRGLDNKVMREYHESNGSGQSQPWSWSRDYIYRGGLLLSSYLSAPGGGEKRYDYHLDHLGTPRLITDAAGKKITAHNYYPFGAEITWTDSVAETMTFTGHERDSSRTAVGPNRDYWYYMHARYDSPNLGRFLSIDPDVASDAPAKPQRWNRYAYAANSPFIYTDPTGLTIWSQLNGPDETQLLDELRRKTGLMLSLDQNGVLRSAGQLYDASGKALGSATARRDLLAAMAPGSTHIIQSDPHTWLGENTGAVTKLNFTDINQINTGNNPRETLDGAAILLHEMIGHGVNNDVDYPGQQTHNISFLLAHPTWKGPVVDYDNKIRDELGLPRRSQYRTEQDNQNRTYIPFQNGPVYLPRDHH